VEAEEAVVKREQAVAAAVDAADAREHQAADQLAQLQQQQQEQQKLHEELVAAGEKVKEREEEVQVSWDSSSIC